MTMHTSELIVDNFAGGGGASTGIETAIGRSVDVAINHDPEAIAMHKANHPSTKHYCESAWDVDPVEACAGKPVGLAWFSPDCKHFSKAKGGKPVSRSIRGLAWIVLRWAACVHPRVIMLENVEEFKTWGPVRRGKPVKSHAGDTFRRWWSQLESLGYKIEMRELRACDYGAPTTRNRLFIIARNDGLPIAWPEPTHGNPDEPAVRAGLLKPWRTAAEIIDWTIPCPSIFERKKPLADATMKRIARGIQKYIVDSPSPYIVHDTVAPALIAYHDEQNEGQARANSVTEPIRTLDTSNRYALVTAFLAKHYAGNYVGFGSDVDTPLHTVTATDHTALCVAHICQLNNHSDGQDMRSPLHTVTAGAGHFAEVRAFLIKYYGGTNGDAQGQRADTPLGTLTTRDRFALITLKGTQYVVADIGMRMLEPRELFNAQGFPKAYIIDRDADGHPTTKKNQVARCGNAVCPPIATALVRANLPELCDAAQTA